jgi:hypothetical protein
MCEREVIRVQAGCKGEACVGVSAYRRRAPDFARNRAASRKEQKLRRAGLRRAQSSRCARGEADVGFSEPSALEGSALADNLSICYVIKRRPFSGVRIEDICGCLPPIPLFLKP